MEHRKEKDRSRIGMPPGTLTLPEGRKKEKAKIELLRYSPQEVLEKELSSIKDILEEKKDRSVMWVNIEGINDLDTLEEVGEIFGMHPLHLEDILNTDQRPKLEEHEGYLFLAMKMIYLRGEAEDIEYEHLSVFVSDDTVITFQQRQGDVFDPVRDRIRKAKGRIRKMGPDYLAYVLLDAVVDNYFVIPESYGEKIDAIEMELLTNPSVETLRGIHKLKRNMIYLRKAVWPLRELINNLERADSDIIKGTTAIYLRDVYNHAIQVADSVETFRDMLSGMVDLYMSSISNKMNETMKVLTVIATIFIPLTFIAGIYGMNFDFMPELHWEYGYFIALGVMAMAAFGMLVFFKRKKWL